MIHSLTWLTLWFIVPPFDLVRRISQTKPNMSQNNNQPLGMPGHQIFDPWPRWNPLLTLTHPA